MYRKSAAILFTKQKCLMVGFQARMHNILFESICFCLVKVIAAFLRYLIPTKSTRISIAH